MQEQINNIETKVDKMYDALVGSDLIPNGVIGRVDKIEEYQGKDKKQKWVALGVFGVLAFLKDHIVSFFTS